MAPDLNSVPASPRPNTNTTSLPSHTVHPGPTPPRHPSTPASRRASQIHAMSPPPLPLASPSGTLPTHAFPPLSPNPSTHPSSDAAHAPMRHPRPLTAAELHLELEKEQEAVVNRLTRELSALRAHSASVASTASSLADNTGDVDIGVGAGGMFPSSTTAAAAARRERRSSSSVSRSAYGGLPHSQSQSQNRSQRQSISSQQGSLAGGEMMRRSSSIVSTPRYEEVALQQAVLEEVKRENEKLKERIRELERAIRGRGEEAGRERGRTGAPGGGADAQAAPATATASSAASSAASAAGAEAQS